MKKSLTFVLLSILLVSSAFALQVGFYHENGCPHCANVEASGILEEIAQMDEVALTKYLLNDEDGAAAYLQFHDEYDVQGGVPLLVVSNGEKTEYLLGDTPIIENARELIENFDNSTTSQDDKKGLRIFLEKAFNNNLGENGNLNFWGFLILILAGLIDSINPCAFGVLIFLMISLLQMGNAKKARKTGLLYSAIIFITYFLAGLGLFSFIQQVQSIRGTIYLVVGLLVSILTVLEFRDYFLARKGKESVLKISPKIKPFIEKYSKQGTILAILILGVVVALFELPCTGGIYLGIISMLSQNVASAYLYLVIYNILFIAPLIVLTLLISKGMSPEKLQKWNSENRTWMKLGAAIILLVLALYLLSQALLFL